VASRRPNPKLVKIHRSYSVEEAAGVCGVHRNTVRHWLKVGLRAIDSRQPTLIRGEVLAEFLRERRMRNKRPCQPGEIYCMRCREPKRPAGMVVEYRPISAGQGNLVGICPQCRGQMFRRVSLPKLEAARGAVAVSKPLTEDHIGESPKPTVNSDFNEDAQHHADAQPR
jgi:hypothetical protein